MVFYQNRVNLFDLLIASLIVLAAVTSYWMQLNRIVKLEADQMATTIERNNLIKQIPADCA